MDFCHDTTKTEAVHSNKAIPEYSFVDYKHSSKHYGNYFLINKQEQKTKNATYSENALYPSIYKTAPWAEILSTSNFVFKQHATDNKIFSSAEPLAKSGLTTEITSNALRDPYNLTDFNNVLLILFFISFATLAWLKTYFPKYLRQISNAIINYSESFKLFKDFNTLIDRVYFGLNFVMVLSTGILLYHWVMHLYGEMYVNYRLVLLGASIGIIATVLLLRQIINNISGFLLNQQQAFSEFSHSTFLYYKAAGAVILPLVAILSFIHPNYFKALLIFSTTVFFLFYFANYLRAMRIMRQKGVLFLYWILYLCSVEILPILLLYKWLSKMV
jgi:hypothetical protein